MDLPVNDEELLEVILALPDGELRRKLELVLVVRAAHPDYKRVLRNEHGVVI